MTGGSIDPTLIKRVVVRGTNWVGDAVMTVPALRELRRLLPNTHIALSTRPGTEGLFADADFIDELLIYDRPARSIGAVFRQTREWKKGRFDLALLFQNAFEAALIAWMGRVRIRIGYPTDGRRALLTHGIALPEWRSQRHEVFYYLNLVSELGKLLSGSLDIETREPDISLKVSEVRKALARELLSSHGVRDDRPLIMLCPGSTNSRAKRWPAEYYARLGDRLIVDANANVVLIGSPDELEVSREVERQMKHRPSVLTGQTQLREAVALLSLADVLITNDTGPAHIAAALDCKTLVIFGPTDPLTTRPFSIAAEVIRRPPECAPCMLRDCPIDHRCMTAITPEDVFDRVRELITSSLGEVRS